MNFLFLKNKWKIEEFLYEVVGGDLEVVQKNHELKSNIQIKGLIENIGKADLSIIELTNKKLIVKVNNIKKSEVKNKIILLIAISRPQTVKKILELGATLGISEVHFFKSETTVKSYVSSKIFIDHNIEKHLLKGAEQSGNPFLPKIFIYKNNYELIKNYIEINKKSLRDYLKIMPSTKSDINFKDLTLKQGIDKIILIGPESGFTDSEESAFNELGFKNIKLSEYILRVETALVYLIAKLI